MGRTLGEMSEQDSPWLSTDPSTLHRVTGPDQAAVVGDPVRSSFLLPFLGREVSVSQAAVEMGCSTNAMLYRVRRMEALGLLRVVATRKRPGRPVRLYRSVHDGWFVPLDAMPYDDMRHRVANQGRRLVSQLVDAYTAVLTASATAGRVLARDRNGDVWSSDLTPDSNRAGQPVHFSDVTVTLTRAEAESLRRQITRTIAQALQDSRAADQGVRSERYLLASVLLPLPD